MLHPNPAEMPRPNPSSLRNDADADADGLKAASVTTLKDDPGTPEECNLFVGDLARNLTEEKLEKAFQQHGRVKHLALSPFYLYFDCHYRLPSCLDTSIPSSLASFDRFIAALLAQHHTTPRSFLQPTRYARSV